MEQNEQQNEQGGEEQIKAIYGESDIDISMPDIPMPEPEPEKRQK